jgi:deazaflavin-dependent oxidoreductase (nitroreductase family)
MTTRMRLLHWLLRALSDRIMLPFFESFGGTMDSTLGGRLCVLHTVGRKSGQPRVIPLNYVPTTQGVGLLAGFGRGAGWVYNLRERPRASVLVGERTFDATAVELTDRVQAIAVTRGVLKNAGAVGFCYGWDPRRAADEQIGTVADDTFAFHLVFDEPPPWAPTAAKQNG